MKNPNWSRDEHIIVLDFYLQHAPTIPGKSSKEVIALSELLNRLQTNIEGERQETFRNPAGVYMKLMNFRRFDPAYNGVGLANGSGDEEVVWDLYANKPTELHKLAQLISSFVGTTNDGDIPTLLPQLDEQEVEGNEGQILSRVHRYRERDASLVKKKKTRFLKEHSRLFCECCGFDFAEHYGEHGKGFIECHHTKPVSELEAGGATKLSDLVMLCSNCHRMIHRSRPWLTLDALRKLQQIN
jgi:5-methylcytosine-specific restriction protein A